MCQICTWSVQGVYVARVREHDFSGYGHAAAGADRLRKALRRYEFIPDPAAFIWTYPYLTRFPDSRFFGHLPRTLIDLDGSMSALA
jgi:hypothetical protein